MYIYLYFSMFNLFSTDTIKIYSDTIILIRTSLLIPLMFLSIRFLPLASLILPRVPALFIIFEESSAGESVLNLDGRKMG